MKKKNSTQPVKPRHKTRVVNKTVHSEVNKMAMESDPFIFGVKGNPNQNQVSFASELGRRGSEVIGLTSGPTSTSIINSTVARKRSRHAVLTNPYAKRAIDIMVSNVVGSGHRLLGATPDKVFNKQVEDLWKQWTDFVDTSGKLNWSGFEALAFRSMIEGGDCFVRMRVRRPEDGLPVPLQLQLYESEQVSVTKNEMKSATNKIIAGIEFDALDRTIFYHMHKNHPGEFSLMQLNSGVSIDTVMIPASEVIHLHDVKRPNEVRGLPLLSQALIKLSDLDRYMDAELVRKKAAALIGGFIKEPVDGNNSTNPFITDENGESDADKEVHIEAMEPGSFPVLPAGYDVTFSSPVDVGINFKEFMRQQLMMVAASINETYEQLTGDMSAVNDRSLRANMLEFKRIATNYQENILVHQFCRTIFNKWFDLALLSGALKIPKGMSDVEARKVRWIADPWPYLNPQQEVNTQISEVRAGFKSRSEIITERGAVPEEVDAQIKNDKDRENDLDLMYTTNAGILSDAGVVHSQDPSKISKDDGTEDESTAPAKPIVEDDDAQQN